MALIKNAPGRAAGGYERLFGDEKLGRLLSRVQSAVIRAGAELERLIIDRANTIDDVDAFLDQDLILEGVWVVPKKVLQKSKQLNYAGVEPDFVVFERKGKDHNCYVIELKDGDTFDTKKAAGEKESMQKFVTAIAPHIQFKMSVHFCCFHRLNKEEIVSGFKRKITIKEAMTGPEFCRLLGIDYEEVIERRKEHQPENLRYFVEQLLEIDAVRAIFEEMLGGTVSWDDDDGEARH